MSVVVLRPSAFEAVMEVMLHALSSAPRHVQHMSSQLSSGKTWQGSAARQAC